MALGAVSPQFTQKWTNENDFSFLFCGTQNKMFYIMFKINNIGLHW